LGDGVEKARIIQRAAGEDLASGTGQGETGADQVRVQAAVDRLGVNYCEATPGSALFFHGNTFHASEANLSDKPRRSYICCYNALSNVPYAGKGHGKPEPITMSADDAIMRLGATGAK